MADALGWAIFLENLVYGACALALAVAVVRAGAPSLTTRLLATYLAVQGVVQATTYAVQIADERTLAFNLWIVGYFGFVFCAGLYVAFAASAISSPLCAPFRARIGRALVMGAPSLWIVAGIFAPSLYITGFDRAESFMWHLRITPLGGIARYFVLAAYAFTLVCAFDAWRRARVGTFARRRARAYLLAFGIQDVAIAIDMTLAVSGFDRVIVDVYDTLVLPIFGVIFLVLLVRALLREQLFDFDLRVKRGVKRTTIAALFLAVFFVAAQIVQAYTSTAFGLLGGAVVAGLLLFALHPVQRAAERVADVAMPRTTGTPEYLAYKKLEVYRAAVESAHEAAGGIDATQRAVLDRLRGKLGLRDDDAVAMESEVAERYRASPT